jgi:hypothetical protein
VWCHNWEFRGWGNWDDSPCLMHGGWGEGTGRWGGGLDGNTILDSNRFNIIWNV